MSDINEVYQVFIVKNEDDYTIIFAESTEVIYLDIIRFLVEYEDVVDFMNKWGDEYYLKDEKEIKKLCCDFMKEKKIGGLLSFIYKDYTWFGGAFNLSNPERDLYNENAILANFHGFKLSSKSKYKRKEATIFKRARKLPNSLHNQIIENGYIGDPLSWDIWGKSNQTPIMKEVVKYFNKLNIAKYPANYFYIYEYDKRKKIFHCLDREVPSFDDDKMFNENNCLIYKKYIFHFYREAKHDVNFNGLEADVTDEEYNVIVNINEEYDFAYYSVRCINNYISNNREGRDIVNIQ